MWGRPSLSLLFSFPSAFFCYSDSPSGCLHFSSWSHSLLTSSIFSSPLTPSPRPLTTLCLCSSLSTATGFAYSVLCVGFSYLLLFYVYFLAVSVECNCCFICLLFPFLTCCSLACSYLTPFRFFYHFCLRQTRKIVSLFFFCFFFSLLVHLKCIKRAFASVMSIMIMY